LGPSFSNSAITQSVMMGVAFAYKQFMMLGSSSNLARTVWERKLVSTRTL
jgi:hypothetical protein